MRDNFSEKTRSILASRVAFRCSFPGCGRITIGPGTRNSEHIISIGEAAHIYSAAPNGPRNNPDLTTDQRSSVENGIWMCKSHARLIDVDEINYSAETLLKWKIDAENFVRESLETLEKEIPPVPLTLVMLSIKLIFQCRWVFVQEETWKLKIYSFIEGDLRDLYDYLNKYSTLQEWEKYIVIESQGDGRLVSSLSLTEENDSQILCCKLHAKLPRTDPHKVSADLAIGDDGDLMLADGDIGMVHGIDSALQIIRSNLSWEFGWWANPHFGSNFRGIYKKYRHAISMLNSMVKLEIVRLMTVPPPRGLFSSKATPTPELNFINRINWVKVQQYDPFKPFLPIQISLEWGNHESWEGELKIPFSLNENLGQSE